MSNYSTRCAACKHLRRRCPSDCILSPYFPASNKKRFECVHKIYGASNIAKMLQDLPVHVRGEAADSLYYEAYCREKDPVYGSVGVISVLQQQIHNVQSQLAQVQAEIATAMAAAQNSDKLLFQAQDHTHHQQPSFEDSFFMEQNDDASNNWFYY